MQPSINQREQERDSKSTDAFLPDNLRTHTHTHGPSSYDRQHQQRKKQPQNTPSHKKENTQPHIKHDSNTPPSYIIKKKKKNIQNRAI